MMKNKIILEYEKSLKEVFSKKFVSDKKVQINKHSPKIENNLNKNNPLLLDCTNSSTQQILTQLELIKQMTNHYKNPIFKIIEELQKVKEESKALFKFHVLTYLILTPRANNNAVYYALLSFKEIGFTPENFSSMNELDIFLLMPSVGLGKSKAKYLKKMSEIIKEKYNGDPPEDIDKVKALPGIGPMMTDVYFNMISESRKYLTVSGHVQRVANRLEWVNTMEFNDTKNELQKILPSVYWGDLNILIDSFGQSLCKKTDPLCYSCLIKDLCPAKNNGRIGEEKFRRSKWYKENQVKEDGERSLLKTKSSKFEKFNPGSNSDNKDLLEKVIKKKKK